jgi:hypothetical protein
MYPSAEKYLYEEIFKRIYQYAQRKHQQIRIVRHHLTAMSSIVLSIFPTASSGTLSMRISASACR